MRRYRKTIRDPESLRKKKKIDPYAEFDRTVDLHGLRSADAERVIRNIITNCLGKKILINHGKGEGTLRQTVRSICSQDARVKKMKRGEETLVPGGDGITIIQL